MELNVDIMSFGREFRVLEGRFRVVCVFTPYDSCFPSFLEVLWVSVDCRSPQRSSGVMEKGAVMCCVRVLIRGIHYTALGPHGLYAEGPR